MKRFHAQIGFGVNQYYSKGSTFGCFDDDKTGLNWNITSILRVEIFLERPDIGVVFWLVIVIAAHEPMLVLLPVADRLDKALSTRFLGLTLRCTFSPAE